MNEGPSLLDALVGYAPAQVVYTAARLGIADQLARGPMTSVELAGAVGAHEPTLRRLLRGLACLGGVVEIEPGRYELTPDGQRLRDDAPDTIRHLALYLMGTHAWSAWGELEYSVRTGKPAWDKVTGTSSFEFFAAHPDDAATFNAAMADGTRNLVPAVLAGYDFSRFGTVVDVGGGDGTLLASILAAVPGLRGVLHDLPAGLESAPGVLSRAGVADRCAVVAGDFFESVPAGGDAYLLKNVIHDWDDERATAILRNCRRAMAPDGVVLLLERVLSDRAGSSADLRDVLSDLMMLVLAEGRERTESEFRALYAGAGLELTGRAGPFNGFWLIAGRAASTG